MIPIALMDRLVCGKYIFHRGVEILNQNEPHSSGIAVNHFQDATEMILRVIAEYHHCSIQPHTLFHQIIDEILKINLEDSFPNRGELNQNKFTHRPSLNQLNSARLNFKHQGNQPRDEDAKKFRNDLEGFFPNALNTYLNIDYESISLINLIEQDQTEKYLHKAEKFIDENKYQDAVDATAIALEIYIIEKLPIFRPIRVRFDVFNDINFKRWAEQIEDEIHYNKRHITLLEHGVNLSDYKRFHRFTPIARVTVGGEPRTVQVSHPIEATNDIAQFCYRFAIDAILAIKKHRLPTN